MRKAFTLIELAIVLTIIGLLIGGSFKVLTVQRENAKIQRAKDDVIVAKEAIVGNTMRNGNTLPNANFFNKNLSPIKSNQHQLLYVYDANFTNVNVCAATTTTLSINSYKMVLPATTPPTEFLDKTLSDIAFVVVSESANANMQTASSVGGTLVNIHAPFIPRDDNTTAVNIVEPYDDVVEWMTLAQLQAKVGCGDKSLRIVNTSLPSTDINNTYRARIVIDGNYSTATVTCDFATNGDSSNDNNFTINNFLISNKSSVKKATTAGIVTADCNLTADGRTVSKRFAITVNP